MQTRIDSILESLAYDLKTALSQSNNGLSIALLEDLLNAHSRSLLTELGKMNIQALPPGVVEALFEHILPQGIDPLIRSLLSYLEIEKEQESIYLDPLGTILEATQELKMTLSAISAEEVAVKNLAWLEYKKYQEAIIAWQEVVERVKQTHLTQLRGNDAYLALRAELEAAGNRDLENGQLYIDEINERSKMLSILTQEFKGRGDAIPDLFFATSMMTWKKVMLFSEAEETIWLNLWNKRTNPAQNTFSNQYLLPPVHAGRKVLKATLGLIGLNQRTWHLKTNKQVLIEMLDKRALKYQEAVTSCQTIMATERAQSFIIPESEVVSAQINQLTQLESYLAEVTERLSGYLNQHHDNDSLSFIVKVKAWLGFKKAREERDSINSLYTLKIFSVTKMQLSTRNVLEAITTAKQLQHGHLNDAELQQFEKRIILFHTAAEREKDKLEKALNEHNEKFQHEWYFWRRKTALTGLFGAVAETCPVAAEPQPPAVGPQLVHGV